MTKRVAAGQIASSGGVNPSQERVFIKAKGTLYLDEQSAKKRERLYSFIVGVLIGGIGAIFSAWARAQLFILLIRPTFCFAGRG